MNADETWWTVAAIARTYHLERWKVWHLIDKGALPAERAGGRVYVQHATVTRVMGEPPTAGQKVVVYSL